ncbi:MAG: hypothetical protein IPN71_07170 [Fibrobacteres bacterium]|nr:hypothetical protein [Fibrobacterota bacterium]
MKSNSCLLLLVCFLLSCGKSSDAPVAAGGFGSETTNGIQVRGQSEPGLVLTARRLDGSGDTTAIRANSVTGTWEATLAAGEWLILAQSGDKAFARYLGVSAKDTLLLLGQLFTSPRSTVFGRVQGPLPGMRVVVEGTDRSVDVAADGTFGLDRIAQGTYLVSLMQGSKLVQRRIYATSTFLEFDPGDPSLLLGSFDDEMNLNPLDPLLAGGWRLDGDESLVDSAGQSPDFWVDDWLQSQGALEEPGKSLHLRLWWSIDADTTRRARVVYDFGGRWGTTITSISDELYPIFRSDSLVFWAKGDGPLAVQVGLEPTPPDTLDLRFAMKDVVLTTQWKRYALSWSGFVLDGIPLGAGFRQHRAAEIAFSVGAGNFWLDKVAITPASPDIFWR